MVPFYNAIISGKMGRFNLYNVGSEWGIADIQELNLSDDRDFFVNKSGVITGILKGYRGGFLGHWIGTKYDDATSCGQSACVCFDRDFS